MRDGRHNQGRRLLRREIAGDWSPDHRHVNVPLRHRLDDPCWWVGLSIVSEYRITAHIVDDAATGERNRTRWIGSDIADELHANPQPFERRVIEPAYRGG